jgi:hypothetical protein
VTIVMVVITGTASNFRGCALYQGNNGVIGDTPALDAMIINNIAKTVVGHMKNLRAFREYIKDRSMGRSAEVTNAPAPRI